MKVTVRCFPKSDSNPTEAFIIRLLPETNAEMADLQWGVDAFDGPDSYELVAVGQKLEYIVTFKRREP